MNITEIEEEIAKLEAGEATWQGIERLSWLYTVHDHLTGGNLQMIRTETGTMPEYAGEFGEAVSGKNANALMNILTEHMAVIKVLHPKEYEAVIQKIKEIP